MKICPYCNHSNEDDAKVCVRCYAGFPAEEKPEESNDDKHEHEKARVSKRKVRS